MQTSSITTPVPLARTALAAAAACAALACASFAFAAERAEAQLATPVAQPVEKIVDGRIWRCDGSMCVGATTLSAHQPLKRECQRAAHALGAFTAYSSGGKSLDAEGLKACNG